MSSSSPLNGSAIPVPDNGSVQPDVAQMAFGSVPIPLTPTYTRSRSGPATVHTIPMIDVGFRHGNTERGSQAQINQVVDRALDPQRGIDPRAGQMPILEAPTAGRPTSRGRQPASSPRPAAGGFGGRVMLMETAIQKQADSMGEADKRITALQGDVALIKLHLQQEVDENAKRQNIAQAMEQRMQAIEKIAAGAIPAPAPAAAPTVANAVSQAAQPQQVDPWANFLTTGIGLPAPGPSIAANNRGGTSQTISTSTVPGFQEKEWGIDRKMSKGMNPFDDKWETYDGWYARMREHAAQSNHRYIEIFNLIEQTNRPIRNSDLDTLSVPGLAVDWRWISMRPRRQCYRSDP